MAVPEIGGGWDSSVMSVLMANEVPEVCFVAEVAAYNVE